jgi:hypothetical protein
MAPLTCSDSQTQRYSFRECQRAEIWREEGGRVEEGSGSLHLRQTTGCMVIGDPVPSTRFFSCEENFEFTGCASTEHRARPKGVEGLNCKRPIQCLAFSKILTPNPLTARRVCTPRLSCGLDTLSGWRGGGGGSILWYTPDTALNFTLCLKVRAPH